MRLFLMIVTCCVAVGKECTNIPTQLSSHTLRFDLLSSRNESWKREMFSYYHLIHTDEEAWRDLLPRKFLREEDEFGWTMMYRKMKNSGGPGGYSDPPGGFLSEVSLHSVRLDPSSIQWRAQQTNLEYLLMLDVDNLVWSFRKTVGLATPGQAYGGWEGPDVELRGHFVGHYLSASAQMWASTHDDSLKEKMNQVVDALSACQDKIGSGYLSAFPSEQFDRFEGIRPVWAPYYTIHKILAGLLDQYIFAGNEKALKMVNLMAGYFYNRVQNVITRYSIERHWLSLNEETGGMNDVMYKLFSITSDPKHLLLAHLFDKPCFLGLLALQADDISGFHANTHIPVVIGSQMRYEITGDPIYKTIGMAFMDMVNTSHSYATGGTSVGEFWSDPKRLATTLESENEESCTTYNMLKVSRHLFRWTKEVAYADYYERALMNGVLSIQRGTEPGVMIYMLPLAPGSSKARSYHGWGTKFDSFWCCYGTGVESFSKLGDSIYFEDGGQIPGVYVIQYVSSSFDWDAGQVTINQNVNPILSFDPFLLATFTFKPKGAGQSSTLNLRVPSWASSGGTAQLNGESLDVPLPGTFLTTTQKWSSGDTLTLKLPISLSIEAIKDDRLQYSSLQAVLYGPYLLAGLTTGYNNIKTSGDPSKMDWITPVPPSYNSELVSFSQESGESTYALTYSNKSLAMGNYPESGTDSAIYSTFRVITVDKTVSSKAPPGEDFMGQSVMLEPFDLPGMVISHQGKGGDLVISISNGNKASIFKLVKGLDGNPDTVSLESESLEGCYVTNDESTGSIRLSCMSDFRRNTEFRSMSSFLVNSGLTSYHPVSFIATGVERNFILVPLFSLRDESYTVYFNISPK
ncbi:hypothetical protein MLD38_011777 [Melastoma candidum]|uniref:Uncharacterized protein n=1 Tax=Melastoma candidum TaxID=119954 RepID=A0ACB9R5W6_9MYRT|nr:hypothetical protein MLD38_011777 [Melastoma candidum]